MPKLIDQLEWSAIVSILSMLKNDEHPMVQGVIDTLASKLSDHLTQELPLVEEKVEARKAPVISFPGSTGKPN